MKATKFISAVPSSEAHLRGYFSEEEVGYWISSVGQDIIY